MSTATRLFVRNIWLQALVMALSALLVAQIIWTAAPATFHTLEWAPYDTWIRLRPQPAPDQHLLLITRDQTSDRQFGAGQWDRSLAATLLTALHDAGASAIGLDIPIDLPSPPHLGGAVSDALLIEAVKSAGIVAYPTVLRTTLDQDGPPTTMPPPPLIPGGSTMQPVLDLDRVIRRAALYQSVGSSELPSLGLMLAAGVWQVPLERIERQSGSLRLGHAQIESGGRADVAIPLDRHGHLLLNFAGPQGARAALPSVTVRDLSRLIEQKDHERLAALIGGKAVILTTQPPPQPERALPSGEEATDILLQAHLLHTLLTQDWIRELPPWQRGVVAFALCIGVAWAAFRWTDWRGPVLGLGVLLLYLALALIGLTQLGWVLPFVTPVTASLLLLIAGSLLGQIVATRRLVLLEQDMLSVQQHLVAVREALVYQETAVESLEEDLESARTNMSHSASKEAASTRLAADLRHKITEAQAQEDATRQRLEALERELHHMRAATVSATPLGNLELEQLRRECEQSGIVTSDAAMLTMFRDLKKGARAPVTVLITGEAGTGKELCARAVHRLSPRAAKPFIAVNMAAISPELFESELFGHVRGSFSGAHADRKGYFELAHSGTIFLDEIGDLRLDHQSKLLRVLQERTFYRVGATNPTTVDVRILAATNKDLQRGVSEGWFREDLYFRLKGLVLHLPPLRERAADIPLLAEACLRESAPNSRQSPMQLSQEAMAALTAHPWKGNVRELRQCLEQAVALSEGSILTARDLRLADPSASVAGIAIGEPLLPDPAGDLAVLNQLRVNRFDMQATARALGWDRSTVTQRLKGLCFQALVESSGDQAKAALSLAGDPSLLRTVELKLMDYHAHLMDSIAPFADVEEALVDCKRRFKNLPERHFKSVDTLVRRHFHSQA